jgi:CDP-diacylglycerol--glycerol-3-phosphate 3-phosphatidyltransferase
VNAANIITLSRFPLLFVIVVLLYCPFVFARTAAFIIYLLTGFSDWLDGYIARHCSIVSNFGRFMDALSDKILTLGLLIFFLTMGILPSIALFAVLLVLGREFFVTGLRLLAISKNIVISAERSGKIKTIIQMVAIGALICAEAIAHDFTFVPFSGTFALAMHMFGVILFIIATFCAVESGVRYATKYSSLLDD